MIFSPFPIYYIIEQELGIGTKTVSHFDHMNKFPLLSLGETVVQGLSPPRWINPL